jgi:hypothetical protein
MTATTLALLKLKAVVGMTGFFNTLKRLGLAEQQKNDLIEYLKSL